MKSYIILICLHSALIFRGYSLTCISCTGTSQTPCTGPAITCPSIDDACTSIYTETKIVAYGLTTYSIVRGCGMFVECGQPKSLSNQFMTVNINTGCCKADNCTPTFPKVSTGNAVKNGLVCDSCFSLTSATCVPDFKIQCTGNETRCSSYSISTTTEPPRPIMAMSGCATQDLCTNYSGTASTKITGTIKISIECNNASVSTGSQNTTSHSSTVSPNINSESVSDKSPVMTRGIDSQSYHFTTDIANSSPSSNTASDIHNTTRSTFTPTANRSTTHEPTTHNGCLHLTFNLCLILILILPLIMFLH